MEAWAVMKLESAGTVGVRRFERAYPTKDRADRAAQFCSYPVAVVKIVWETAKEQK